MSVRSDHLRIDDTISYNLFRIKSTCIKLNHDFITLKITRSLSNISWNSLAKISRSSYESSKNNKVYNLYTIQYNQA